MTGVNKNFFGNLALPGDKSDKPVSPGKKMDPIVIADYDNTQGKDLDIENFKKDVARSFNTTPENIIIIQEKSGLKAKLKDTKQEVKIEFKDKFDLSRMAKYAILSQSMTLINFGQENTNKKIKITDYEDGLSRDSQIQLFKEDVSREMKTPVEQLEIQIFEDNIAVHKIGSTENFLVEFADPADFNRFLEYTKQSKSKRLADFGLKKTEAVISLGGDTRFPNPKDNANFNQNISYSTFLGDSGIHKLKIDVVTDVKLIRAPELQDLKEVTITYANSDMPITGTYGDLRVSYKNGKFDANGKYEYLDLQVDKIGKKIEKNLKDKDAGTIALAAGAIVVVGAGVWAAAKYLPKEQSFDIPLKAKVYGNGLTEVRAAIEPTVTLGAGKFDLDLKKGGVEVKHNIASGTNIREKAVYDLEKKELSTEFEANFDRANIRVNNLYSFENPDLSKTTVYIGKSHTVSDGLNISYSYSQELDRKFNSSNQSINFGLEYTPNDSWKFNLGGGVGLPSPDGQYNYGINARTTYRF